MIDPDTRLRVARGVAKTETLASVEALQTLKERGHPEGPPPLISDGWGGIGEALLAVYGKTPPYPGRGRPPTRKQPQADWKYLQMVKKRRQGRVVGTELRVIYGAAEEVLALLGRSTAYVERNNLTSRLFNGRLTRKTLGFSKDLALYRASCAWEDLVYNLGRGHKSLRCKVQAGETRRWRPRSPAMAAGLTDHLWSVRELLTTIATPNT